MRIQPVSDLVARACRWFWLNRLGLGKLALLDGDPGLGKSLLTLDLCARLSTGRPMPDGTPSLGPANSLILCIEDGKEDTLKPRLAAMGSDERRVFTVKLEEGELRVPQLPDQAGAIEQLLRDAQARLLVIDPIVAFLSSAISSYSDQSVRRALMPLAVMAEQHDCAVLLIRHLSKQVGRQALYRGCGSIGLMAACRSAWLLAADPQEPNRRVFAQLKNNLAAKQPSLSMELRPGLGGQTELHWPGISTLTADDLAGRTPWSKQKLTELERASDFLVSFLKAGPRLARDVWHAGQAENLSQRTLQRAQKELGIAIAWSRRDGIQSTYWLLKGHDLPPSPVPTLERWLKPMREKYPVKTPLEED